MEKVVNITHLKDKTTAYSFWLTKTDAERLQTIEMLRQQYINYTKNVQPGLQRICRIINKKQR